jgi:hypothetical protein
MHDLEQAIRERAYHLWVADGHRNGNAEAHWLTAKREVLASSLGNVARVTVTETPASSKKSETKSAPKGKVAAAGKKRRRAA